MSEFHTFLRTLLAEGFEPPRDIDNCDSYEFSIPSSVAHSFTEIFSEHKW